MDSCLYDLWLSLALGAGHLKTGELFAVYPEIRELYEDVQRGSPAKLPLTEAERAALAKVPIENAEKIIAVCERKGYRILNYHHKDFPKRLREIEAPPCQLFVQGELPDFERTLAIACVGTRNCSEYGRKTVDYIVSQLAGLGVIIVSGLALGIDGESHRAALNAGGKTVAVLGNGLDISYPIHNRKLRSEIEEKGAVVTEYPPGVRPYGTNFPLRNRIIAGLSNGVVVFEAPEKSGSLITASQAVEQGKEVFAVPGSIFSACSAGCHRLIADGAFAAFCARDILQYYAAHYNIYFETAAPSSEQSCSPLPSEASDLAKRIYENISEIPKTADELALTVGEPIYKVLSALTELELYECVILHSGHRYSR